jgi:chromosome segregation ATPase
MPQPRVDYPKAIWESASSLSDNAQNAALRRVRELGFDEAQGEIPLEETFINLSSVRDVLLDTVEKGRLTQLPLRLQSRLLQEANRIGQAIVEITNGKDAIRALENSVEELNATIYQLNLQNQSEAVLGLERKINELKGQEVIVKRSMSRANRLEKRLDDIEALMNRLEALEKSASTHLSSVGEAAAKVDGLHETVADLETQAKAAMAIVHEYQESIANSDASARQSEADLAEMRVTSQADRDEILRLKGDFSTLAEEMETLKQQTNEELKGALSASTKTSLLLTNKSQTQQ